MKFFLAAFFFLVWSNIACAVEPVLGFLPGIGSMGDNGYNSTAYRGMVEAKIELQAKLFFEECKKIDEALSAVEKMLSEGVNIMVLNGYEYKTIADKVCPLYPNVKFILNEIKWPGTSNSVSLFYKNYNGAFLAGALAGWTSPSSKTGIIAAVKMKIIEDLIDGFSNGLAYSNPEATLSIRYLAEDSSGFNMPDKAFKTASVMYEDGIDTIFGLAGLSSNGIIEAAKKKKRYCIGIDSNQDHMAKGHVLTSMMKNVDIAIKTEVIEAAEGTFRSGTKNLGLSEGAIGLSAMKYTKEMIGEKTLLRLETLKKDLIEKEHILSMESQDVD